ncbi:hypothetical protein DEU56DRAFT_807801 [Suillus clintonianus]|uniref:uncharacterized protein n=1 Tax=Suillus clintonianus TaxID=1904413 RepID=UPI001B878EE9|nr:uncharacterized protein DEU56DRAFT_807801 [Suillus clintonianus]KAG2135099.1 hypothetical protein DEU56DRAFT_807801 [Suillus clintonianus]
MEKDIKIKMYNVWTYLPPEWDMILLVMFPLYDLPTWTRTHPSYSRHCTHAYALSLSGARRLLQYLHYPPFAYPRAPDQAFSLFIDSGRLRAFSALFRAFVFPRKVLSSDIIP